MELQQCLAFILALEAKLDLLQETKHMHCMLHRYALAAKTLPSDLRYVLDDVVHIINYIKKSALNSRIFRLICEEFEKDGKALLFHTEVRWLSRGNILARVFSLRNELSEYFIRENNSKSSEFIPKLMDSSWLSKLAYLRDVFSQLNEVDLKFIRTPFSVDPRLVDENVEEAFIDMINNSNAKDLYEKLALSRFWCEMCVLSSSVSSQESTIIMSNTKLPLVKLSSSTLIDISSTHSSERNSFDSLSD
ncbi:zinc finger BED domain-containing protein 5-like [Octopus sinensis]|uniref:Zinc finger BED domain-containing protein 5-like n=1 Tax=Octopus sinensis TaxID=2607531 RepID=A0A6P7U0G0_9MOLL|nr:zinc finger BED domain-containing protein 5-like [Octopus sinensis]